MSRLRLTDSKSLKFIIKNQVEAFVFQSLLSLLFFPLRNVSELVVRLVRIFALSFVFDHLFASTRDYATQITITDQVVLLCNYQVVFSPFRLA